MLHFIILYAIGLPDPEIFQSMKDSYMSLFGFKRNLAQFMEGFSLTMGVFMFFYGGMNMILYRKAMELFFKVPFLFLWNGVLSLLVSILSMIYFHWPPVIIFCLSAILNTFLYFKFNHKKTNTSSIIHRTP